MDMPDRNVERYKAGYKQSHSNHTVSAWLNKATTVEAAITEI